MIDNDIFTFYNTEKLGSNLTTMLNGNYIITHISFKFNSLLNKPQLHEIKLKNNCHVIYDLIYSNEYNNVVEYYVIPIMHYDARYDNMKINKIDENDTFDFPDNCLEITLKVGYVKQKLFYRGWLGQDEKKYNENSKHYVYSNYLKNEMELINYLNEINPNIEIGDLLNIFGKYYTSFEALIYKLDDNYYENSNYCIVEYDIIN